MSVKLLRTLGAGQLHGSMSKSLTVIDRLVGSSNEVSVVFGGSSVSALLGSGSMVSTISKSLCDRLGLQCHPVQELLSVEGVGGQKRGQYQGYMEAAISFPDLSVDHYVLLLVVPDTSYNETTPVLLGTNILQVLMEGNFDSKTHPGSWQMVFKALSMFYVISYKLSVGAGCETRN